MPHRDYSFEGVRYPSVTEIIGDRPKPWLDTWKKKWGVLAERKTAIAKAIGTCFHENAERLADNQTVDGTLLTRRLYGMLDVFADWAVEAGLKVKEAELHVVSHVYKFQGTFDATGYLADKPKVLTLIDYKTSSGIYPDYAEQLIAYAQAYFEQTGIWIKRGLIVHISKDKPRYKLTVKEYKLNKRLLNKFLKRLAEYREYNPPVKGLDA